MEIWKDVIDYENSYQVSNLGRVRTKDRLVNTGKSQRMLKSQLLKGDINRYGYVNYRLWKNNKLKNILGHRLVALHFLDNPLNKKEINHLNGIKCDNKLENLEWATRSENALHAFKTGLEKPKKTLITKSIFETIEREILEGSEVMKTLENYKCSKRIYYYRKNIGYNY